MMNPNRLRLLGVVLYTIGVILGTLLAAMATVPDLEAYLFDADTREISDLKTRDIECPVVITTSEIGQVRSRLENPTDKTHDFIVRAHISQGFQSIFDES